MADRCRSCGAPIEWAVTAKGRRIPLDVGEFADGNVVVDEEGVARVLGGLFAVEGSTVTDLEGAPVLRRSHFASCPHADRHRRRR